MKRGKDHSWEIIRVKGDMAYYAKCKCGYWYKCSKILTTNPDGSSCFRSIIDPEQLYPYCACCGARKKYYDDENIQMIDWDIPVLLEE